MIFSKKMTFVVFTFNEETRIERVIKNFTGWADILIVDNYSKDATREIAEKAGAKVFLNKNNGWVEDYETVERIKNHVKTPWLYWGYADEMLDYETLNAIFAGIENGKFRIVNIARKNYYYGVFCHDAYADRSNRIFERNSIDFMGNTIHNFGRVTVADSEILFLNSKKYYVRHFISNTAKQYLNTIDRYTDIQAGTEKIQGAFNLLAKMSKAFLVQYIFNGAYKAGKAGFFLVLQMQYYQCLLAMKVYERKNDLTNEEIESLNNKRRDAVLNDIKKISSRKTGNE